MNAKALVASGVLLACCFWAGAAGASEGESRDEQPQWGPAKSGLQTSLGLRGEAAVAGKLVLTLSVRNSGDAAVRLGARDKIVAWLLVAQNTDEGKRRHYSQKVHPAKRAKRYPGKLSAGKVFKFPAIDLSDSGAYPYDMRRQVLPSYIGTAKEKLPAPTKKLTEVVAPGETLVRLTLFIPRDDEPAIIVKSNILRIDLAPPDLGKLSASKRKAVIAELIAKFDKNAFAAMAAHGQAVKYGKVMVPALVKAAGQGGRPGFSRMWLTAALADIRDPRAAEALVGLLGKAGGGVASVVAYHGPKQANEKLDRAIVAAAAKRKDHSLTSYAVLGFMVFRGKVPGKLLEIGIASGDPRARATVAKAMAGYASDFNIRRLVKLLKDADQRMRSAAATTLGMMKRPLPAVLTGLVGALGLPGELARTSICRALSDLTGKEMPYSPAATEDARRKTIMSWRAWLTKRPKKGR